MSECLILYILFNNTVIMGMISENKDFFLSMIGLIVLSVVVFFLFQSNGENLDNVPKVVSSVVDKANQMKMEFAREPEFKLEDGVDYSAVISTNLGDIEIDLFEDEAPKTVNNFVFLAEKGFYDNTIFHRVIKDFVIQGGDRNNGDGTGDAGYKFADEINWDSLGLSQAKQDELKKAGFSSDSDVQSVLLKSGTVAMANSGPNTNSSQFFIVSGPDASVSHLNGMHTVFGKVINGWDVVSKIQSVATDENQRPKEDIVIENIEIKKKTK